MMSFSFGLFTQMSDLGPHGPLVIFGLFKCKYSDCQCFLRYKVTCIMSAMALYPNRKIF